MYVLYVVPLLRSFPLATTPRAEESLGVSKDPP